MQTKTMAPKTKRRPKNIEDDWWIDSSFGGHPQTMEYARHVRAILLSDPVTQETPAGNVLVALYILAASLADKQPEYVRKRFFEVVEHDASIQSGLQAREED